MWLFRRIAARIKAIAGSSGLLISPLPQWSLLFCECYSIKARTMSPCLRLQLMGYLSSGISREFGFSQVKCSGYRLRPWHFASGFQ